MKKIALILSLFVSFLYAEGQVLYRLDKTNEVIKTDLNGKNEKQIATKTQTDKIAVDSKNGNIYWISGTRLKFLRSAKIDGTQNDLSIELDPTARSITTDGDYLYWVVDDAFGTAVIKSDFNGKNQKTVFRGKDISCLVIDTASSQIFWVTDNSVSQRLRVTDLDGQVVRTLLRRKDSPYTCVTIDSEKKHIYWIKSEDNVETTIWRCDFNGRQKQEIVKSSFITDVAAVNGTIYWVGRDAGGNAIFQTKDDGKNIDTVLFSEKQIKDIVIK